MGMENLKYTEILLQNRALAKEIKGPAYKISFLTNITISTIKEIVEYVLRINQINPAIEIGNYDNIVQDSSTCKESDLVVIFFDMLNIIDGVSTFFEDLDDEMYNNLKNRICSEIDIVFENLKDCPSVVINTFSSGYFVSSYSQKSKIDNLVTELNEYLINKKRLNITLLEMDKIISKIGIKQAIDFRFYQSSKAPYTLTFLKNYVSAIEPVFLRNTGKLKKAILFDCDNTLWKGIIGEDGIDKIDMSKTSPYGRIFNTVQQMAVFLSKRGVIVGICSKNNENDVSEVFTNHPDMVLKDEYIVIKKINWQDKSSNLKSIASELNIGLDSMVFVDDSSFEINLIKEQIPEIVTLQVPPVIYEYPDFLLKCIYKYFNLSVSSEDAQKTEIYKQQFQREYFRKKYETIDEYLSSLNIGITIFIDEPSIIPRVSQLTQKTNQFNLTTRRYTENQILTLVENKEDHVFAVSVKDKFGDNGLTAVCIIVNDSQTKNQVIIDTLLMSCRIIGRGIEYAFMNYIMEWLTNNHYLTVLSEFISTKKNEQVDRFYEDLGFRLLNNENGSKLYSIKVADYKMRQIEYIRLETDVNIRESA
jgi:FkbH-like protein